MLLWKWNQVHRDLIQINIQISFISHGASQVIDNIGNDSILFFKMISFLFLSDVQDTGLVFNLFTVFFIAFVGLEFIILGVYSGYYIK
jgi:hypothetical protein